jgi:glycogen debranching enzyme
LAPGCRRSTIDFQLYSDTQKHLREISPADHLSIDTPDQTLNQAFAWAEVAIDQLRVETTPSHAETALVAGFYTSGDSARPGFGWYFGRDALWTLYAVNSYGDYQLTRDELNFLIKRQSPEGKIIHEWAQTADLVDWKSLPYAYASADANPLLLMATNDYLKVSGDTHLSRPTGRRWSATWKFECSHDSDGDGIYENTEGSGWVESWPPGMPHQEIYLAALDQQASTAMADLARATGHTDIAQQAALGRAGSARPSRRSTCFRGVAFMPSAAMPMAAWIRAQRSFRRLPPGMAATSSSMPSRCSTGGLRRSSRPIGARAT